MSEAAARGMAKIGATVAVGAGLAPHSFLRLFGIKPRDVTGAAAFGWRLFGVRTAYLSALALRGDQTARNAFLPVQLLDQIVFWHAFYDRSIPRRAAVMAATASAAIVALDALRRHGSKNGSSLGQPRSEAGVSEHRSAHV